MNDQLIPIFCIALLGGLFAGIICSVVLLVVTGTMIQSGADYILDVIQVSNIECSSVPASGASVIKLNDQTLYCSLSFGKVGGQEKEITVDPVPGGDYYT